MLIPINRMIDYCNHCNSLVTPDVEIIVPHGTRVSTGTTITMHCNVSRTNPGITAYRWIHGDTNILLGNTNMLTLTLTVTEDFGIYQCEVTNAANLTGIGNVTIEQGCKYESLKLMLTTIMHYKYILVV